MHHVRKFSKLSLIDLSLSQFSGARTQLELVDKLVRVKALRTPMIISAFQSTDRVFFLHSKHADPASFQYAEPYENVPQELGGIAGSTMSTPHHHAIIAEQFRNILTSSSPITILELVILSHFCFDSLFLSKGCGSGYLTTVFAKLVAPNGGKVIG